MSLSPHSMHTPSCIYVQPANYCEMYPVIGYELQVEGSAPHSSADVIKTLSNDTLFINNLPDNKAYSFSVVVWNSVGNVSTAGRTICELLTVKHVHNDIASLDTCSYADTTDVQIVTALMQEDTQSFLLQCDFIASSNAQGCMVVLVGEFENITGNVTRDVDNNSKSHTAVLNAMYPLSNYSTVFGYDIEFDGSIGTLAVPGVLVRDPGGGTGTPEEQEPHPSKLACLIWQVQVIFSMDMLIYVDQNIPTWVIIMIGVILGVALVIVAVIMVFVGSCHLVRRLTKLQLQSK